MDWWVYCDCDFTDTVVLVFLMTSTPFTFCKAHGRTLFRIHGNNQRNDASEGCIVLPPNVRRLIAVSADRRLEVVR